MGTQHDITGITADSLGLDRPAVLEAPSPGPLARLSTRVRAQALDRELAEGADPSGSAALAHRAARLTSGAGRRRLADGLERLVARAEGEGRPNRFQIGPARDAVLANREELRALVEQLRGTAPLYAYGLAMLSVLLSDGTGPLYARGRPDVLARRLDAAQRAL